MRMYSVYDKLRGEYNLPFGSLNDDIAIRDFGFACQKNPFYSDLSLFYVGDFDLNNGRFIGQCDEAKFICNGASAVPFFKKHYSDEVEKNV